jgi:Leucine-rich repeat (LRR) protein
MKKIVLYILLFFSVTAGAQAIVVPDADFMAKLLASSAVNGTAKDSDGDAMAIDANGNGIITEEEAAEVRELNVSGSGIASMTGIEYFIDLRVLDCSNNEINGTLNISALEDLRGLYCANNNVASINFAVNNDIRWVDCSQNQLASLQLTSLNNLETLDCGNNALTALDVTGLEYLSELRCNDNNLTTLDLNSNTELAFLACYGNELITLFVKNGATETFDPANWSGSPTLEYICADESQVAAIQANENLPATTQVNSYCSYEPGGIYNRIAGVVRYDANNNNNCGDAGDYVIPSFRLRVSTVGGIIYEDDVFTKTDGSYIFYVGTGLYTVTPVFENNYFTAEAANVNLAAFTDTPAIRNICVKPTGESHPDVEIVIAPETNAQPGSLAKYKMVYKNKGNQVIPAGSVTCNWDSSKLNFFNMDPNANIIGVDTYTWLYEDLMPFKSSVITMELIVNSPTSTPPVNVGDILTFGMSINPGTDDLPEDNYFEFQQEVVGSLASNNIICIEGDVVSPDAIGDYLHYIVNFENTGTAPADFVVVEMDVDPDQFDISTLRLINSSQTTTTRVSGDRVTFRLEDASLSVAGHGNILYKIKSRSGLMTGDAVTTSAKIYFNYNFPVQTNDADTTLRY